MDDENQMTIDRTEQPTHIATSEESHDMMDDLELQMNYCYVHI